MLSHLLLALSERPPDSTLRNLVSKHQNLVDFCARFRPLAVAHQPQPAPQPSFASWVGSKYELFLRGPNSRILTGAAWWKSWIPGRKELTKAASVVGVVALFVGYVIGNGIVKIELGGKEDEEDIRPPKLIDINAADIPHDEEEEGGDEEIMEEPLEEDIADVEADDFDVDTDE